MVVAHGFNQSSQQKPGIETDLCQQIHCWFELKKTNKVGWDEGGLLNFLDFTELGHSNYLDATMHYFSRKGKNGSEGNSEIVRAATPPYTWGVILFPPVVKGRSWGDRAIPQSYVSDKPGGLDNRVLNQRGLFLALKSNEICLYRFQTFLGSIRPSFLLTHILSKFNIEWNTSFHLN